MELPDTLLTVSPSGVCPAQPKCDWLNLLIPIRYVRLLRYPSFLNSVSLKPGLIQSLKISGNSILSKPTFSVPINVSFGLIIPSIRVESWMKKARRQRNLIR